MSSDRQENGNDEHGPRRSIGETARLIGVSPGMLRLWERKRLVNPSRTPGGHRLYSSEDLRRLRHIARLRRMDGLNAAAIRQVLGPPAEGDDSPTPAPDLELGRRLRAIRTDRGLSLASVADAVGLSTSFLSAVELGQTSISVGNLFKLADAYGTTVPGLGPDYRSDRRRVLRPQDRPRYVTDQGRVVIEDLIATPGAIEAQRIEIQPNGGSEEPYAHPGEEFIYVLAGQLAFWLDEQDKYQLQEGDSLFFRSTQLHRWWNESENLTTVLWINVPVVHGEANTPDTAGGARHRNAEPDSP